MVERRPWVWWKPDVDIILVNFELLFMLKQSKRERQHVMGDRRRQPGRVFVFHKFAQINTQTKQMQRLLDVTSRQQYVEFCSWHQFKGQFKDEFKRSMQLQHCNYCDHLHAHQIWQQRRMNQLHMSARIHMANGMMCLFKSSCVLLSRFEGIQQYKNVTYMAHRNLHVTQNLDSWPTWLSYPEKYTWY